MIFRYGFVPNTIRKSTEPQDPNNFVDNNAGITEYSLTGFLYFSLRDDL
jgi:hypothetical protein